VYLDHPQMIDVGAGEVGDAGGDEPRLFADRPPARPAAAVLDRDTASP